ncbi:MAG: hypothetical protein WC444_06420 [Candidatus Paceibacterota bacterium]
MVSAQRDWSSIGVTPVTVQPLTATNELEQLTTEHRRAYELGTDPMSDLKLADKTRGYLEASPDNEGNFISAMNRLEIKEQPQGKSNFDSYLNSLAVKEPLSPMAEAGVGALKVASRTAGVGLGTLNAMTGQPFMLGYMSAETYDPQQFWKMPYWQQIAVRMGAGFVSTLESISTPGKWGVTFEDYYKMHMGKTIDQDLEAGFEEIGVKDSKVWAKRLAPSIKLIMEVITDPSMALVPAAQLAKLKVPKGFVGEIPPHVMDQIKYLSELDDVHMKRKIAHTLRKAYDARLWGIKEGATWQNIQPGAGRQVNYQPEIKNVDKGGIVEGESLSKVQVPSSEVGRSGGVVMQGATMPDIKGVPPKPVPAGGIVEGESIAPTLGMDLKVGIPQAETLGRTQPVVTGGDVAPKATMGTAIPNEPATIPEAAKRIMEAARVRKERYVAEGHLAKSSGVSALGFINQVRKRLGMPSYGDMKVAQQKQDELYGTFVNMLNKSFARGVPGTEVETFDLGVLVQAAKEVFGPTDTLSALKVIEAEDSAVGRTLKAAMPDLEKTLGSGQFTEPLVQEGKTVATKVKPPVVEKKAPPVKAEVKVAPKVEPSPPVTPTKGTQVIRPKSDVEAPEPGMRVAEGESDIFDDLADVGVSVERPSVGLTQEEKATAVVPGKTFRSVKKGDKVPGFGTIVGIVPDPNIKNKMWVSYLSEDKGKLRFKSMGMDDLVRLGQAQEVPTVTLDMLGFQKMFDDLVDRIKIIRAESQMKTPFQKQIPNEKLFTTDWNETVKKRRTITFKGKKLYAPEVKGLERNIAQNLNEIPMSTYRELFENPIRVFEYAGPEAKELFYRPIKEGEHAVAVERRTVDKWMQTLREMIDYNARKRIGTYAIAQQRSYIRDPKSKQMVWYNDGLERLKAMGITEVPKLSDSEMQVYKLMREKLDEFYLRLNAARVASGHAPFPKVENYFTFMHDFSKLENLGMNPMTQGLDTLERFIHPTATPFKYAKHRGKELLPLELDAFTIMEKYLPQAVKHIHMSPRIAKIRELSGIFQDAATGDKWQLSQTHPNFYKYVNDWLTYQTGIQQGTVLLHGNVARAIMALNRNMTFALLSYNLRTMLIQFSALRNTIPEIGVKHTFQGVRDLIESIGNRRLWREPFGRSNVLLGRAYDVSMQQAFDAIRGGRIGQTKQVIGKAGMKPIQWLDIATAWTTWRGAYRKGMADGLSKSKAANYADDVVVKTQASGAPSDIAKIQRSQEGRMLTLLQTFVINDWNFFIRDVLGMGNPRINSKERFEKLGKYIVSTTLINMLYEDFMGMNSPFPTPLRAAAEALEEGESLPSASWQMAKELLENVPVIGGGIRYGQTPFGPAVKFGEEAVRQLYKGDIFTAKSAELAAKGFGVPGTAQATKIGRESARGEPPWTWLAGKRTIDAKKPPNARHW